MVLIKPQYTILCIVKYLIHASLILVQYPPHNNIDRYIDGTISTYSKVSLDFQSCTKFYKIVFSGFSSQSKNKVSFFFS